MPAAVLLAIDRRRGGAVKLAMSDILAQTLRGDRYRPIEAKIGTHVAQVCPQLREGFSSVDLIILLQCLQQLLHGQALLPWTLKGP